MTLQQLRARRDEILAVAAHYGATNVRIFGSVVRNENTDLSDIDLMVDLERKWTLWDRIGLIQDLEDLLGCRVDVVVAAQFRPIIREYAMREATPL